jgi:ribosomal protein L35
MKITATGKVKRRSSFAGHLMSGKSGRRRQRLRQAVMVPGKVADNIREALRS